MYEGVANCAMSQLWTLEAKDKTLKFCFFIRVYYGKIGHIPELHVAKFHHDLFGRSSDIAEKQVLANLKQIVYA